MTMSATNEYGEFCSECGFRNCPHMEEYRTVPTGSSLSPSLLDVEFAPESPLRSFDDKNYSFRMMGVTYFLQHYFGGRGAGDPILCSGWRERRDREFPLWFRRVLNPPGWL